MTAPTTLASPMPHDPLKLAQALIQAPSVTPKDGGAMQLVAEAARQSGFDVDVFETCGGAECVKNLVAVRGTTRPILAFVGHTDVVPPGDEAAWKHPPFSATVEEGWLYGRGAVDMKTAIAAFISATQRYTKAAEGNAGSIMLLITGDEEVGSPAGMRAIIERIQQRHVVPDVGLVGEASNERFLGQGMRVGRRGSLNVLVESTGVQGHVAWPEHARNAVHPLVQYLAAVQSRDYGTTDGLFPATSLQITNISVDNRATNVVPAHATAQFNLRFNRTHTGSALSTTLRSMATTLSKDLRVDTRISGEPYLCEASGLSDALARASAKVTGHTPSRNAGGGVSDGRFLHKLFPVVEFGLVGDTAHQMNERVAVGDVERLTEIYSRALHLFFQPH